MIWHPMEEEQPPEHKTVLLYRHGDLSPVVGWRYGRDPYGKEPERELYMLEEGGPEDGEHRKYPFLDPAAEPTHWAHLPEVPFTPVPGNRPRSC